jgi:hypothetical protein
MASKAVAFDVVEGLRQPDIDGRGDGARDREDDPAGEGHGGEHPSGATHNLRPFGRDCLESREWPQPERRLAVSF